MKYIIWISVFLTCAILTLGEEEYEERVEAHHIQKRSCYNLGEECTKDVDCCSIQCLCTSNDCRCGKRQRASQLKKKFRKRTCGT
nr:venom protein [Lampona murina]